MADREDPLVAFKFGLEIEGKLSGFFTNVHGAWPNLRARFRAHATGRITSPWY